MECLFIAELAILLQLHAVGIVPLVLVGCIVSLLAVRACHSDDYPHVFTPPIDNLNKEPRLSKEWFHP